MPIQGSQPHYKPTLANTNVELIEENGKQKIKVRPIALAVIWGSDSRYWRIPAKNEDPLELLQVSWLEVSGSVDLKKLKKGEEYKISFMVTLKSDAFGWSDSPVYLMAKPGKGAIRWKKADLSLPNYKAGNKPTAITPEPRFKVDSVVEGDELHFGMYEIWKGRWKGGLVIHEVIIEQV